MPGLDNRRPNPEELLRKVLADERKASFGMVMTSPVHGSAGRMAPVADVLQSRGPERRNGG